MTLPVIIKFAAICQKDKENNIKDKIEEDCCTRARYDNNKIIAISTV